MENPAHTSGSTAVSPVFQVCLILINLAVIATLVWHRSGITRIAEHTPNYFRAADQKSAPQASLIRTGLHVDHFEAFETRESIFTFSGTAWFEFDPDKVAPEKIADFTFESGISHERRPLEITTTPDGKILAQYAVKETITRPMDHRLFPLDSHRLYMALANRHFSADLVRFISSKTDFVSDANLKLFGWKQVGEDVECGFKRVGIDETDESRYTDYPVALFSIDITRSGIQFLLLILLPLLFIFYLALFTLSAGTQNIGITASVMVAIPGYRIVIQNIAPSVGYLVLSDYLFFIFLAATGCVFLTNIITSASPRLTERHRRYAIIAIHTAVLAACTYLFEFW